MDITSNADEVAAKLRAFRISAALVEWIDATSPEIVAALKKEAPYGDRSHASGERSGEPHLRDRIWPVRHSAIGAVTNEFVTDRSPVAEWVLGGTKPHEIHPKESGYPLRFWWEQAGGEVESWGWHGEKYGYVMHPGTKPNPFNVRAWVGVEGSVVDSLFTRLERALV